MDNFSQPQSHWRMEILNKNGVDNISETDKCQHIYLHLSLVMMYA